MCSYINDGIDDKHAFMPIAKRSVDYLPDALLFLILSLPARSMRCSWDLISLSSVLEPFVTDPIKASLSPDGPCSLNRSIFSRLIFWITCTMTAVCDRDDRSFIAVAAKRFLSCASRRMLRTSSMESRADASLALLISPVSLRIFTIWPDMIER